MSPSSLHAVALAAFVITVKRLGAQNHHPFQL